MAENETEDPKEEAKAEYMRAKWAVERTERAIARIEKRHAEAKGPEKAALMVNLKEARSLLQERKTAETKAKSEYDAAKAAAKAKPETETAKA